MAAATKAAARARISSRFKDAAGNKVMAVCQERKRGWLTFVTFREKGQKAKRGAVATHDGQGPAHVAHRANGDQLVKNGWTAVTDVPVSAFTDLPKAKAAPKK